MKEWIVAIIGVLILLSGFWVAGAPIKEVLVVILVVIGAVMLSIGIGVKIGRFIDGD